MAGIPNWRRYVRVFGADAERAVEEELAFHLEAKTRDLVERGWRPEDARAEALRQFGEVGEMRALCRSWERTRERTAGRRRWWMGWRQDLRDASRGLRRTPLLTAVAVLSIALGLGANTAVFTLLDQVLLRALPVSEPDRLVRVRTEGFYNGSTIGSGQELSYPLYAAFRDHNDVFDGMFAHVGFEAPANAGDGVEVVRGELVTGTYFSTLGVGAIRGRVIGPDDDRVPGGHSVAVISHGYWQRRFGGDPTIVGRSITISRHPMTIIGVLEPGFHGLDLGAATQLFVPMMMESQMTAAGSDHLSERGRRWLNVFARLKPGVTPEGAAARLEPFYRAIREENVRTEWFAGTTARVRQRYVAENHVVVLAAPHGHTPVRAQMRNPLWLLMAIVSGVLLIACANVANLLLARGAARQRDIAIRLSLGATRARIARQMLVESVLLAIVGGAAGLALASVGVQALIALFADPEITSPLSATPDLRILVFTGALTLLTGLLFGTVPALLSTRPDVAPTLKDQSGRVLGGGPVRLRKTLVAAQVALSLVLLIAAGMFIRTLNGLMTTDLGFRTDRLVTFGADPTRAGYDTPRAKAYAMDLIATVRATPGVTAAGFSRIGVLWGGAWATNFTVEGYRPDVDERVASRLNAVSPGYFEAMGIPLLAGRDFRDADAGLPGRGSAAHEDDTSSGYRVAIVSQEFARRYIDGHPIGRRIGFGDDPGTPTPIEIVGVVKDSIYTDPSEDRRWQVYVPFLESPDNSAAWFYVRTTEDPTALLQTLRRLMRDADPDIPPLMLRTVDEQLKRRLVNQRLVTTLSATFGALALLLASVGLYGVMAHDVARRTREIGVRIALGARAPRVAWLVMREALLLITIGVAVALLAAWWLAGYMRSTMSGLAPADPLTIGLAILTLTTVAAAAALIPALRAARVNPTLALRHD